MNIRNLIKAQMTGKKRRKIILPKPLSTKPVERQYYTNLKAFVDKLIEITNRILIPRLTGIISEAEIARPGRADAYDDEIERTIENLKLQFYGLYTEAEIRALASRMAGRIEVFNTNQLNRQFKKVLGVNPFVHEPFLRQEAVAFTKQNVKLITSISEDYFDKLEQTVFRNVQQGKLTKDIAEEIKNVYGVTTNRAKLIARDQVSKFNGNLTRLRQKNVGIEKYKWSNSGDERVRGNPDGLYPKAIPSHWAYETQENGYGPGIFSWEEPPEDGHPGAAINCRCVALPVFEDTE